MLDPIADLVLGSTAFVEKKKKKKKNGKVLAAFLWDANVPKPFAGSAKKAAFFLFLSFVIFFFFFSFFFCRSTWSRGGRGEILSRTESTGKIRDAT